MESNTIHENGVDLELTPEQIYRLDRMGLLCKCDDCPHYHIKPPFDWHDVDMALVQVEMDEAAEDMENGK